MEDFWPTVHMQVDAFIQNSNAACVKGEMNHMVDHHLEVKAVSHSKQVKFFSCRSLGSGGGVDLKDCFSGWAFTPVLF